MADLKTVPLPAPDSLGDKDVVKTHMTRRENVEVCGGEYMIQQGKTTIKISLVSPVRRQCDDSEQRDLHASTT